MKWLTPNSFEKAFFWKKKDANIVLRLGKARTDLEAQQGVQETKQNYFQRGYATNTTVADSKFQHKGLDTKRKPNKKLRNQMYRSGSNFVSK